MPSSPNPEFCAAPSRWPQKTFVSGAGGPFGAVIVRDGRIIAEGVQHRNRHARPYGPRRSQRHPRGLQGLWNLLAGRLRALPPVAEALPHVPRRGLWGAPRHPLTTAPAPKKPPAPALTTPFLYDEAAQAAVSSQAPRHATASAKKPGPACRLEPLPIRSRTETHLALPPGGRLYCEPCNFFGLPAALGRLGLRCCPIPPAYASGRCRSSGTTASCVAH